VRVAIGEPRCTAPDPAGSRVACCLGISDRAWVAAGGVAAVVGVVRREALSVAGFEACAACANASGPGAPRRPSGSGAAPCRVAPAITGASSGSRGAWVPGAGGATRHTRVGILVEAVEVLGAGAKTNQPQGA